MSPFDLEVATMGSPLRRGLLPPRSRAAIKLLVVGTLLLVASARSPADTVSAYGVNNSGLIVGVDVNSAGTYSAFEYNQATKVYTFLSPPGATNSQAIGINDSGQIVGSYGNSSGNYGFLLTGGTYTTIIPPGTAQFTPSTFFNGGGATAAGINNNGVITGSWTNSSGNEYGFTYAGATFIQTNISYNSANFTFPYGINDSGIISGYIINPGPPSTFSSFLYNTNTNTFTSIAYPGAVSTIAQGINDSGEVVGFYRLTGQTSVAEGFVYNNGTYTTVMYPGADSTDLFGISNSGEIVGSYTCSSGMCPLTDPAFYATPTQNGYSFTTLLAPTPEPSTAILLGIGLLIILGVARQRCSLLPR